MKIFVTGANGFLGQHLVPKLSEHQLLVPRSNQVDLMNYQQVEHYIRRNKPEIVIHLAAHYGGLGINHAEPDNLFFYNTIMATNLFDAAARNGVKKIIPMGSSCFPPNSRVVMSDCTIKNIEDIKVGDNILTQTGPRNVSNIMSRTYDGTMVHVKCTSMMPFECTEDHEWLTFDGVGYVWKNASMLKIGDLLCMPFDKKFYGCDTINLEDSKYKYIYEATNHLIPMHKNDNFYNIARNCLNMNQAVNKYYSELHIDKDIAYLLGVYLAEGYLNLERGSMGISYGYNDEFKKKIEHAIAKTGLESFFTVKRTSNVLSFNNKQLCEMVFSKFYNGEVHRATTKVIPKFILELSRDATVHFIRGYWDGDGCVYDTTNRPAAVGTTSSIDLAYALKYLLAKLGIVANLKRRKHGDTTVIEGRLVNCSDSYSLRITGQHFRSFMEIIYDDTSYNRTNVTHRSCTLSDGVIFTPIIELSNYEFSGMVYNLEEKNTASYIVNGLLCHNCSYPAFLGDLKEEDFWNGRCHDSVEAYGFSKKLQLVGLAAYRKIYNIDYSHLVLTNMYGEYDDFGEYRGHAISVLVKKFADAVEQKKEWVGCWGDGSPIREFLYVGDAATAIAKYVDAPHDPEPVNIGTGVGVSIKELVAMIVEITQYKGKIEWITDKPNGVARKVMNIEKMKRVLGWEPKMALGEGLEKTIRWYRETYYRK